MKFEVGKTYATRSICDHECFYSFTILARTAKQITTTVQGKVVRRGLSVDSNGIENFKPFGSYSMCAVIGADDLQADAPTAASLPPVEIVVEYRPFPVVRSSESDALTFLSAAVADDYAKAETRRLRIKGRVVGLRFGRDAA